MAVTKIWAIHDSVSRVVDYCTNPSKTKLSDLEQVLLYAADKEKTMDEGEQQYAVTGIGCRAESAAREMAAVQRRFGKAGGNVAYHAYQSFKTGEVTAEECHRIGVETARRLWGNDRQVLVATHFNTGTYHNHFVVNPVNMWTGKKLEAKYEVYYKLRDMSDRICKEHGLSVIVPGRDKGKSYIEHQAEQNGTSYKAKLRSAIDRLLPGCAGLEDLLRRLQREGYELKRGKYISARAPGQERFTRLKALGADYAEEALSARIAGMPSPSRQPKQRTGKPSLLIDIQNNIKAQQSAGYKHWATIENLKRAAETLNFLTEHGIGSLEDLSERCDGAAAATARVKADLRATKKEMERLTLTMKHAATYRQLRPLYEEYRQSRDKEKFLRGHEGEIILFEAAARELKRLDAVPLPATKRLRAEMDGLTARRTALQSEYRKAQREEREYDTLRQNVEALLEKPREAEPQRQRNHELE